MLVRQNKDKTTNATDREGGREEWVWKLMKALGQQAGRHYYRSHGESTSGLVRFQTPVAMGWL